MSSASVDKELEKFHPTYCEKYEVLRGIYPNDRRETGEPCTCGFEKVVFQHDATLKQELKQSLEAKCRIDELGIFDKLFMATMKEEGVLEDNDTYHNMRWAFKYAMSKRITHLEAVFQDKGDNRE